MNYTILIVLQNRLRNNFGKLKAWLPWRSYRNRTTQSNSRNVACHNIRNVCRILNKIDFLSVVALSTRRSSYSKLNRIRFFTTSINKNNTGNSAIRNTHTNLIVVPVFIIIIKIAGTNNIRSQKSVSNISSPGNSLIIITGKTNLRLSARSTKVISVNSQQRTNTKL